MSRVIVLLSGGLDSATMLAMAVSEGHDVHPLMFRYGQRHEVELEFAIKLCEHYDQVPVLVDIDFTWMRPNPLLDGPFMDDIPRNREMTGIAPTYIPGRNTIFLSHALALSEVIRADEIWIGANKDDYEGYPDCRPGYFYAFEGVSHLATAREDNVKIWAPLIRKTKKDIGNLAITLGVPIHLTWSCYQGDTGRLPLEPCGECDACRLRVEALDE